MKSIELPSGGKIDVEYESDDYAFVQDKRATDMVEILGFGNSGNQTTFTNNIDEDNCWVFFRADAVNEADFIRRYLGDKKDRIKKLFFKCYVNLKGSSYEDYIMGYSDISGISGNQITYNPETKIAGIKLPSVSLDDNSKKVNPIVKTAVQYIRINLSEFYTTGELDTQYDNPGVTFFKKLVEDLGRVNDLLVGEELNMYIKGYCRSIDPVKKSYLRLKSPTCMKKGGGLRVKKISIDDQWGNMGGSAGNFQYGQMYNYTRVADVDDQKDYGIPVGTVISSGVTPSEPFVGSEENTLREPDFYKQSVCMAPDNQYYMERPYGEMFYPSPSVGYSRVTVTPLKHVENGVLVSRTSTGRVENDFYTAKDFPVKISNPIVDRKNDIKRPPFNLLKFDTHEYVTVSQSYAIELNDMHGKEKAKRIYPEKTEEGDNALISEVKYIYKTEPLDSKTLSNSITSISKNGIVNKDVLAGVDIDMVLDERENKFYSESASTHVNLDVSAAAWFVIPLTLMFPNYSQETTRFRSITNTKVVSRYGVLEKTIASDLGSYVETSNLAWDNETGEVLLTRTNNEFDDPIYSFHIPSHWAYDGMAPSYQNIGFESGPLNTSHLTEMQANSFVPGDELSMLKNDGNYAYGWVTNVIKGNNPSVEIVDRLGKPLDGTYKNVKIIRSGHRNQQSIPVESVTLMENPLKSGTVDFEKVLTASAVEYESIWDKNLCEEEQNTVAEENQTSNPYITGKAGNYRPKSSYSFLTGRTQSNLNRNTNIRRDGILTSFSSFWNPGIPNWTKNEEGWISTSEVTMFSPYGMELENKDPLERYSSAIYGYNFTLPVTISVNAMYNSIGNLNFEDELLNFKPASHFRFLNDGNEEAKLPVDNTESHSGSYSVKVNNGDNIYLETILVPCGDK